MWRRRRRALDSLDDDLRDHLAREIDENLARGMTLDDAQRHAHLAMGNVTLAIEHTRQVWAWAWLDETRQDLRYAVRTLRRHPAFAGAATATLALAIAANTAMFSVLHAVLLRPLPYDAPAELTLLWTEDPAQNLRESRSSLWSVREWRRQAQSFVDLAVFDSVSINLTTADGTERIVGASVSGNLLALLGVAPALGRGFPESEGALGNRPVLISYPFWQQRFGGAADAIGTTLVLDGQPSEIVGVLPEGFRVAGVVAAVWRPVSLARTSESPSAAGTWFVVGRLRPDASVDRAQAEMTAIARRLNEQFEPAARRGVSVVPLALFVVGSQARLALWTLGGAVFCVLLIAAANVTSLSLARAVGRAREMAVRAALGASSARIVRQVLVENVVLSVVAGAIGTALAAGAIQFLRASGPATLARLGDVRLDLRVVAWTAAISLGTGLVVGLASAATVSRANLRASSEAGGRGASGGVTTRRIRRALVVTECALAVVLLVGAGLLVRSWHNVSAVDPGYAPKRVLQVELSGPTDFTEARRIDLYRRVLERLEAVPGVEHAGMIGDLFVSNSREYVVTTEGEGASEHALRLRRDEASVGVFSALGTPLRSGRFFSTSDGPGTPRVVVVNEALARRLWPGRDPVGARLKLGRRDADAPWFTVVGVVADMRRQGPEREAMPQMFEALSQTAPSSVDLLVRSSTERAVTLADAVRAAVREAEPLAPVYGIAALEDVVGQYVARRRFETWLLTAFAFAALLMAAVGIYGILQYSIATRTREIGLRLAVGAQPRDIFRMLVGEGVRLTATGLVIGVVAAAGAGRLSAQLLFGVTPLDPLTFGAVATLLMAVAAGACYFPARRAMRTSLTAALGQG
jgi:putative ABC transport system permease protein